MHDEKDQQDSILPRPWANWNTEQDDNSQKSWKHGTAENNLIHEYKLIGVSNTKPES